MERVFDHTFGDADFPKIAWSFWFGKSVVSMLGGKYSLLAALNIFLYIIETMW